MSRNLNTRDVFWTNQIQMKQSLVGKRVAGTIRSKVNARDLQLECTKVLHETLLVPVLMYDNETMLWK